MDTFLTWTIQQHLPVSDRIKPINKLWIKVFRSDPFYPERGFKKAAFHRRLDWLQFFNDRGFHDWNDAMIMGVKGGHISVIRLAIEKGAYRWNMGMIAAIRKGDIELTQFFIDKGKDSGYDCKTEKSNWRRGMRIAIHLGHIHIVKLFLKMRVEVDISLLYCAVNKERSDIVELLLDIL